jgi:AcrR family transcriptional regulator
MTKRSKANIEQPLEENEPLEPRSRPVQERSRQTVNRILETAAELVDEVGVVGFTTNLLAERADIRVRTIYRYFPSKLGILSALMNHLNDESAGRLKRLSDLGDPECDWRELINGWFDDVLKWTRERPGARLLMGWSHNVPELVALEDRMDEEWARCMMDAMRARGVDLPPDQLYAVCRTFTETFDSTTSLAGWEDQECADEIVAEARRMLVRYLEHYLD